MTFLVVILLVATTPAIGFGMSKDNCSSAAQHREAMRKVAQGVPTSGLSLANARLALSVLDMEWKRAFGDTVAQARYQEAMETYAISAQALVVSAQHPGDNKEVSIAGLQSARREEATAYLRLLEQAQLACPAPSHKTAQGSQ